MRGHPRLLPAIGVVAIAVTACGGPEGSTLRSAGELPAVQEATTTTTTTRTTGPTTSVVPTTTLPGEPFDASRYPAGAILDGIGIGFDETLDLLELPGSGQPIVASLPPLSGGIESQGRMRIFEGVGIWVEVTATGVTGWVNSRNVTYLRSAEDVTAAVTTEVGGIPTAPSMLELGQIVTDIVVPSDPTSLPEIVVAAAPSSGATSEVVYDTFPGELFGGDTSRGSRVVVVGRQLTAASLPVTGFVSAVGYELVRVDEMVFCTRGVTSDNLCV